MSGSQDRACAEVLLELARRLEDGEGLAPADPARAAACLRRAAVRLDPECDRPQPPVPPPGEAAGKAILYADGGSRGNPGPAGCGAYLVAPDGRDLARLSRYLGRVTNNVAEYEGLIMGLGEAARLGVRQLEVRLDSELIVKQLSGQYRVKSPHLLPLYQRARSLLAGFAPAKVVHVPRAQNAEADALANQAMDRRA